MLSQFVYFSLVLREQREETKTKYSAPKWPQLMTFKAEDFKTLPYPGNNVIVVSNHGLKTGEKNSRKGEFWKEMPDIN